MNSVCLLILAVVVLVSVDGHVRLTYPQARQYDFDFLTNYTTNGPCGMPENALKTSLKTKLISGSIFDVTWHMTLSHRGNVHIQLLYGNGSVAFDLTPKILNDSNTQKSISTVQNYTITLPQQFSCHHCILRLVQEVTEWNHFHKPYALWSCADVEIGQFSCSQLNCYNNGNINHQCDNNSPVCICANNRTTGQRCQYQNECQTDADCNHHGRCLSINQGFNYPLKQCYCSAGFYGYKCSKISSVSVVRPNDIASYTFTKLDDNSQIWYKILRASNEIEVIHQTKTVSWVGLGWRPRELKQSCQLFPAGAAPGLLISPINSPLENQAANQPVNHSMDCMDMVIGSARGNLFRLFDYYSRDRSTPRIDEFYEGRDSLTAAVGLEINGITTLRWRRNLVANERSDHTITHSIMDVIYAYGQHLPSAHQSSSDVLSSSSQDNYYGPDQFKYHGSSNRGRLSLNFFGDTRLNTTPCSGSWETQCATGECTNQLTWNIYNDGTIHFKMVSRTTKWIALGISNDKKMNNSDAIVGWYDDKPTLTDRYMRGRIPFNDYSSNVYLINGSQINGTTTLSFYRYITTIDRYSDISLQGCHYFFYGVGGDFDAKRKIISKHPSTPSITSRQICINGQLCQQFSGPQYETLIPDTCSGRWITGCSNGYCQSYLSWNIYNDGTIHFRLSSKTDKWIALGFSYDRLMPNTDAIIAWYYNNTPTLIDSFIDDYNLPKQDTINDAYLINSSNVNGEVTFHFYRRIITGDTQKDSFLFGCNHFFLAVGGNFNPVAKTIDKHPSKPSVASICIYTSQCLNADPPDVGALKDSLVFDNCSGRWTTGCDIGTCQNDLRWAVYNDGRIEFIMASRTDRWIAMGISDNRKMNDSDAIVAWYSKGKPTISDRYLRANSSHGSAQMDNAGHQNVFLINSSVNNGQVIFRFYRNTTTNDTDTDISLEGCHYFFFAIGGSFGDNDKITKHWSPPYISSRKICIRSNQCADYNHVNAALHLYDKKYKFLAIITIVMMRLLH